MWNYFVCMCCAQNMCLTGVVQGYNRIGAALAKLLQPHSDLGRAQPRIALQVIESLLSPTFAEQEGAELDYIP